MKNLENYYKDILKATNKPKVNASLKDIAGIYNVKKRELYFGSEMYFLGEQKENIFYVFSLFDFEKQKFYFDIETLATKQIEKIKEFINDKKLYEKLWEKNFRQVYYSEITAKDFLINCDKCCANKLNKEKKYKKN